MVYTTAGATPSIIEKVKKLFEPAPDDDAPNSKHML